MTGRLQNGYYQGEINGAFLLYFAAVLLFSDVMTFVLIVWNEKDENPLVEKYARQLALEYNRHQQKNDRKTD